MKVIGYDDTVGAWTIVNSWSTQWGDEGTAQIAYDN